MTTVSEEIYMRSVSHGHYTNRYGEFLGNNFIDYLNEMYTPSRAVLLSNIEVLREAYDNDTTLTKSRFRATVSEVLDEMYEIRDPIFDEAIEQLDTELREFSVYETDYAAEKILQASIDDGLEGIPLSINVNTASSVGVFAAAMGGLTNLGKGMTGTLNQFIKGMPKSERRRFGDAITGGFANGSNNQAIIRSVFNRNSGAAEESKTRQSAISMAKTSVAAISQQAKQKTGDANDPLIEGWRNVAVFDARTSQICQAIGNRLGSEVFPNYEDIPPVPRHPRCRSQIIMVTKPWNQILETDLVALRVPGKKQKTFTAPTKESPQKLMERLQAEGLSNKEAGLFVDRFRGETSELSLSGFLAEQKRRGNVGFLNEFFGAKARAKLYMDGELPLDKLYDYENRKFIPLAELK